MNLIWHKKDWQDFYETHYKEPVWWEVPYVTDDVIEDILDELGNYGMINLTYRKNIIYVDHEIIIEHDNSEWSYLGYFEVEVEESDKEYMVMTSRRKGQTPSFYYSDRRKDAEEVYDDAVSEGMFAEICFGIPGNYITIKKNY